MNQYKYGIYLMTCVCGVVDAVCFLALNGVFADMMTGNLLMLAISLGTWHQVDESGKYLRAMIAFTIGLCVAGLILKHPKSYRQPLMGYSVVWCLLCLSLVLTWVLNVTQYHHGQFIVALLAGAMGVHNGLIRVHGLPDLPTNLMTVTLSALVTESPLLKNRHERNLRRLLSICLFVLSASVTAMLVKFVNIHAAMALALILMTAALWFLSQKKSPELKT